MNIKEKIAALIKEKIDLDYKLQQAKSDFKTYITNKDIPVLERWHFFINAPAELKEQSRWIIRPQTAFLNYVNDNWFDAPEVYGRGKRIYIDTLFEDLIYGNEINPDEYITEVFKEDQIKEGLEELLEMNLEYFSIDW